MKKGGREGREEREGGQKGGGEKMPMQRMEKPEDGKKRSEQRRN